MVDDVEAVREAAEREGLHPTANRSGSTDFTDPWGNNLQVVAYQDVQFERVPAVKRKLGIGGLEKSQSAQEELQQKGLA